MDSLTHLYCLETKSRGLKGKCVGEVVVGVNGKNQILKKLSHSCPASLSARQKINETPTPTSVQRRVTA